MYYIHRAWNYTFREDVKCTYIRGIAEKTSMARKNLKFLLCHILFLILNYEMMMFAPFDLLIVDFSDFSRYNKIRNWWYKNCFTHSDTHGDYSCAFLRGIMEDGRTNNLETFFLCSVAIFQLHYNFCFLELLKKYFKSTAAIMNILSWLILFILIEPRYN